MQKKNLNFIIARGKCLNKFIKYLNKQELENYLYEFSDCSSFIIPLNEGRALPPFMAADIDHKTVGLARVKFLIDLTLEAENDQATPFYSKILRALSTRFFERWQNIDKLWFPFIIQDTVGKGISLQKMSLGTVLLKNF